MKYSQICEIRVHPNDLDIVAEFVRNIIGDHPDLSIWISVSNEWTEGTMESVLR